MITVAGLARWAYNALPSLPSKEQRDKIITELFENTLMFLSANVMLAFRGHPVLFISGYFTGIALDKAVEKKFEKIKRVALFTLFIPICCGQSAFPYLVHTATFLLAAKIGSVVSLRYNREEPKEDKKKDYKFFNNVFISLGAVFLWLLKGHPFSMLAGFISGTVFENETKKYLNKLNRISFGDLFMLFTHAWFIVPNGPYIRHATSFVLSAQIGSLLSLRSHPKPDGTA